MPKTTNYKLNVVSQNYLFIVFNYSTGLVTIATTNFDRLLEFYCHFLGQEPVTHTPNIYAEFRLPGLHLGIFRPQDSSQFLPGSGAMSLCLEVGDLEQAIAHAGQVNCSAAAKIMTASHGREAYVYDPDGNRIILHQGRNARKL